MVFEFFYETHSLFVRFFAEGLERRKSSLHSRSQVLVLYKNWPTSENGTDRSCLGGLKGFERGEKGEREWRDF